MNCLFCDEPMEPNARGRKKKHCSRACSNRLWRDQNPDKVAEQRELKGKRLKELTVKKFANIPTKCCIICSSPMAPKSVNMGATCCSKACRSKRDGKIRRESGKLKVANMTPEARNRKIAANERWSSKLAPRQCVICKETRMVRAGHVHSRPMCQICGARWSGKTPSGSQELVLVPEWQRSYSVTPPVNVLKGTWWTAGKCLVCAKNYVSPHSDKTCSVTCKVLRDKDSKHWITRQRREAIYERDNWICQICYEPADQSMTYDPSAYQPDYASLDHITPRSLGGTHEDSNLRLAHSLCNSLRGTTV